MAQWLVLHVSTAGGLSSIPGQGAKIPQALWCGKKKKKKKERKRITEYTHVYILFCILFHYGLSQAIYSSVYSRTLLFSSPYLFLHSCEVGLIMPTLWWCCDR